jgi:hypothetical protein
VIEINIDNTGDFVEDLVIQAVKRGDKMYFFGPYAPSSTGTSSMINTSKAAGSVAISAYGATPVTSTENGMKFSPDLETILSSLTWVSSKRFLETLLDLTIRYRYFAGTNVLSVEVPK